MNSIVGKGTTFTVFLPQQQSIVESVEETNISVEEKIETSNKPTVLIVDDNVMNLKIEQRHLEYFNVMTDVCESGEECINKYKSGKKYDVILMDDMMPGVSGTDTMKKLKQELNCNIPIIVLTANATDTAKQKYLADGFDEFIAKPVNRETLFNIVKKHFK